MSSPCKRIKLTPKKVSTPRTTQETRVTSTPQRSVENLSSPNVSSITSKSIRTRLSDVFEELEERSDSYSLSSLKSDEVNIAEGTKYKKFPDYCILFGLTF